MCVKEESERVTNSWWAKEEKYEGMLFIIPTILFPPDSYRVRRQGKKERRPLFQSFAFVDFAFPLSILSFSQLMRADLRATGIPETMIKERKSRDEKRVRDIWWKKEEEEIKQRWETSRKLPAILLLPPQSVGPLASSNCVSLSGAAMVKSV